MNTINYLIGCRNCMQGDSMRHLYMITNSDITYEKYRNDYETKKLIEQWRYEGGHTCHVCNSTNIDIFNIKINDTILYDYNKLVEKCISKDEYMLQINIEKQNSVFKNDIGGSNSLSNIFIRNCFTILLNIINERNEEDYKSFPSGSLFICFTGKKTFQIETFRFSGLSKSEILSQLYSIHEKLR
jgi:hypothetical protein